MQIAAGKSVDMTTQKRPYEALRALVESLDGGMTYLPLVPGGVWVLTLRGRTFDVRVESDRVNDLDSLYQTSHPSPAVWADYPEGADLVPDAFWRLVELFQKRGRVA